MKHFRPYHEAAFKEHPIELMSGDTLLIALIQSNMLFQTKHEIVEWLWANRKLDDAQYKSAMTEIERLEKKS